MDYQKKRGTQYYDVMVEDPDTPGLVIEVRKKRRVVALEWAGPDEQVYRAPDTEAGRASLDARRRRMKG